MPNKCYKHLIIGGQSQDGKVLSSLLRRRGQSVITTSRSYSSSRNPSSSFVSLKLEPTNTFEVLKVVELYRPQYIYMLSAQSSVGLSFDFPADTFQSNIVALISLLEAVRHLGLDTKIFYPLSTDMFGDCSEPANEETSFNPSSPYAVSKISCYEYIKFFRSAYHLHISTAFLSNHESIYRSSHFVTHKLALAALQASRGNTDVVNVGNLSIMRDWGWAEEYMDYVLKIMSLEKPDDFIIATGSSYSLRDLASTMFQYLDLDYSTFLKESSSYNRLQDISISRLSNQKLFNQFGSVPKLDAPFVAKLLIDNYLAAHE